MHMVFLGLESWFCSLCDVHNDFGTACSGCWAKQPETNKAAKKAAPAPRHSRFSASDPGVMDQFHRNMAEVEDDDELPDSFTNEIGHLDFAELCIDNCLETQLPDSEDDVDVRSRSPPSPISSSSPVDASSAAENDDVIFQGSERVTFHCL